MPILRGEVYFVQLGPTVGRELDSKRRPVVVISKDALNSKPLVVIVVPGGTWNGRRVHENEAVIDPSDANGLSNPTVFQCHQMRAIDHSRFDRPAVGVLTHDDLDLIEKAIRFCLDIT
jgi:mRNA interferase MazF